MYCAEYITYLCLFSLAGLTIMVYSKLNENGNYKLANVVVGVYVFFVLSVIVNYEGVILGV